MFQNVGGKLKTVTYVMFVLTVVLEVILGFCLMAGGSGAVVVIGLLIMVIGFLVAWISALFMLGYAELVENTDKIAAIMSAQQKRGGDGSLPPAAAAKTDEYVDVICPHCREELAFLENEDCVICPNCLTSFHISAQQKEATTVLCPGCGSEKKGAFCAKCGHHFE